MNPDADVIDQSIAALRRLTELLSPESMPGGQSVPEAQTMTPVRRTRKEILLSISVLLPKLEAARPLLAKPVYRPRCDACEDS